MRDPDAANVREHITALRFDVGEVAKPWLKLRQEWQAILDGASPGSNVDKQAREQLRYIDTNLRRLDGR